MTKICYLDGGASFDLPNSVRVMVWLRLYLQVAYQYTRNDVLATSVVNDEVARLVFDRTP